MTQYGPYVVLLLHTGFRLLTVFAEQQAETDILTWSVSIWSPLVWLDRTIHEHYWISTGWTNRPDGVGSAGGWSQTAGRSIPTGGPREYWQKLPSYAGDWRHLLISRRTNKSYPVVNLNSQLAQLQQPYGEWGKPLWQGKTWEYRYI